MINKGSHGNWCPLQLISQHDLFSAGRLAFSFHHSCPVATGYFAYVVCELTCREASFYFAFQQSPNSVGEKDAVLILFIYLLQSDCAYYVGERENKVLTYLFDFRACGCFYLFFGFFSIEKTIERLFSDY